jgi:hypothetical protein
MRPKSSEQRDADAVARVLRGPVDRSEVQRLSDARVDAMRGRLVRVRVYHYGQLVRLQEPVTVRFPKDVSAQACVDGAPQRSGRWIVDIIVPRASCPTMGGKTLRADLDALGRELNYGDWCLVDEAP